MMRSALDTRSTRLVRVLQFQLTETHVARHYPDSEPTSLCSFSLITVVCLADKQQIPISHNGILVDTKDDLGVSYFYHLSFIIIIINYFFVNCVLGNRFKKSICLFLNPIVELLLFCLYMSVIPIKYVYTNCVSNKCPLFLYINKTNRKLPI